MLVARHRKRPHVVRQDAKVRARGCKVVFLRSVPDAVSFWRDLGQHGSQLSWTVPKRCTNHQAQYPRMIYLEPCPVLPLRYFAWSEARDSRVIQDMWSRHSGTCAWQLSFIRYIFLLHFKACPWHYCSQFTAF